MAVITLRSVKGSALTNAEVDANFSNLNTELGQKLISANNLSDLSNAATARSNLGLGSVENKSSATIRGELTSSNVTTALGFTPYNATNPSGYITSAYSGFMLRSTAVQSDPNTNFVSSAYRFDPNANNPTNEYYAIVTYGNESNVVGQLATHFQTGQTFTRAYNSVWSAWRTVLDSSNYSSYALPLSGGTVSGYVYLSANGQGPSSSSTLRVNGDITTARGNGATGVIYLGNSGSAYLYWDGGTYYMPSGPLAINGHTALHAGNYNSYSPTLTGTGASGTWGIRITGFANQGTARLYSTDASYNYDTANPYFGYLTYNGPVSRWRFKVSPATPDAVEVAYADTAGSATDAATLTTARTINGTSFNGSANITTASWGTARTLTIGATGKSVDGSGNVSWTLGEIGAVGSGNTMTINAEYSGTVAQNQTGWYTIASYGGGRAEATFHLSDLDSSRHNYVRANIVWSYGYGGIVVDTSGRHGVSTIRNIRLLYNTSDRTYGGVKVQVYCEGTSDMAWTLRVRQETTTTTGWGNFTEVTPVLEGTPAGWAEGYQAYYVNEQGQISTSSSSAYFAGNLALHAGNYSSYALPLSGGTLTGALYFTDTTNGLYKGGDRLSVRSESTDNVANFASYGLYLPQTGQTAGLYVESPIEARSGLRIGSGAGSGTITVGADTSETASRLVQRDSSGGIFGTYIRARKNQTAGNYTTAALWTESYGNTATGVAFHISGNVGKFLEMRTDGILYWNGDTVIHSGNYSSYALPISGGTLTGAIRAPQITAGGSTNTDANLGVQGTAHITGTIYYGGTVGNVNSWSSLSTSSGGTHTFSGSRFIFDRYGYGSQPLIDMQSSSITLSQPTYATNGITVNDAAANGRGINLYSGSPTSPTYGLFFAQTGNFGTYGAVSADWATYFTMNSTTNRGWIFREVESLGNVAAISNQGNMTLRSHFEQGNNIARPNVSWSAGSTSTGMVIFYLPGTTSNYGMVHMVFDIYEYNGNAVSTVIVGGHNWSSGWYNVGANVIGQCGKEVRLGVKDGRFCVVFGTSGSSWEYGTIVLRKIHNGGFYDNIIDMVGNWSATQTTTESFTNITGDLRALRTPASFNAGGAITQAGNQVLHAGNYNSYSPTLGGTGANGTWGIDISGNASTASQVGGYTSSDGWLRKVGDSTQFQVYGNSRTIVFRTDGVTNPHGGGGYPYIWFYGGSGDGERRMILNTSGDLWTNSYGWLHDRYLRKDTSDTIAGKLTVSVNGRSTSYQTGNIEVFTSDNTPPSIGFHRGGYSATSLYESDGELYANAWTTRAQTGKLLSSGNYSSYALPISGGSLSGTIKVNTSGSGSATSHLIIKRSGASDPGSFGSYSGSWRSGIEIWNNDSTLMLFLNPPETNSAYGNIKSVGGGLLIGVGSSGATTALQFESNGSVANSIRSSAYGASSQNSAYRMAMPRGASASWDGAVVTGAIKIRLPVRNINSMWRMKVAVYNYSTNTLHEYHIGSYSYSTGGYNAGASCITTGNASPQTVRIGNDGTYDCVWIGETSTVWSYPVVSVTDFTSGYRGSADDTWAGAWDISYVTSFGTVGETYTPSVNLASGSSVAGNAILHAGNYNSYSPTLTGGGASGSWGINITGNASNITAYTINQSLGTGNDPTFAEVFTNGWFRNNASGQGLYNTATGNHFYSDGQYWNVGYSGTTGIRLRNGHAGPILGYLYGQTDGNFGLLHNGGGWAVQVYPGGGGNLAGSWTIGGSTPLTAGNYGSYALPLSAGTSYPLTGVLKFSQGSTTRNNGIVGTYDPTKIALIWAMGESYLSGADGTAGNCYGLTYSYDPDYGATGNNPGAKSGLGHQMQWRSNGTTQTAIGTGVWTIGNVTAYSDERLKTDWAPVVEDFVSKLAGVKAGSYSRTDIDMRQVGVSAQSLRPILPEAVPEDVDGYLSVSYGNAAMVSAVELAKEVVTLRGKVASLEAEIEAIKALIRSMK